MSQSFVEEPRWAEIYAHPEFRALEKKRRAIVLRLLSVTFLVFFSIPFISSVFPGVFRMRIYGPINVGLTYMIAQYFIGGLIAWRYARSLVAVDALSGNLLRMVCATSERGG